MKLRIGVWIETSYIKKFEYEILQEILNKEEYEVILLNHSNPNPLKKGLLYCFYSKIDSFIYDRGKNYVQKISIDKLSLEVINLFTLKKGQKDYLVEKDIKILKNLKLDLIVKFGSALIKGEILSIPTYGIWEYTYGEKGVYSDLAGLYEVLNSKQTISVYLEKLPDNENDGYIIDSFTAVSDELSYFSNKNIICWKTHMMMPRNIQRLTADPDNFIKEKSQKLYFFKDKIFETPSSSRMVLPLLRIFYKNIVSRLNRFFYKAQWSIYFVENEINHPFQRDMTKFIKIKTPKKFFWADPFVVDNDDKSYIFFEDYVYKTGKGHISVIVYDHNNKRISEPKAVIKTNYHQSYPFIMKYKNEFYMIPEGCKDKDIKIYKAIDFPYKWEIVRTFFKGKDAVDMTLFHYENRWWLFTNMIDKEGLSHNEELYIYYCNDFLTDEWKPHKQNPVVSSIQFSRPAGKIISYKGDLYRPSQNSVGGYGYGTNFNKICILTPEDYKEEFISEITPDFIPGAKAIHTYNSSDKLTVIDVLHKIRRF